MKTVAMSQSALPFYKRKRLAGLAALLLTALGTATPAVAVTQSWNGYRWARTGLLTIGVGNNLTSAWSPYLTTAANAWSSVSKIDFKVIAGKSTASCAAVYGTVQACNGNYGANGWLGYANVWLSNGFIVQATVRLNDYYFNTARYNTAAWKKMTACQELGHTIGLDHADVTRTNTNLGTCMDYTNDPTGTAGTNGVRANIAPNATDFAALDAIYATTNTTQLAMTKPQYYIGSGFSIEGAEIEGVLTAVPEPSAWLMMVVGFGFIGTAVRLKPSRPSVACSI